MSASDDELDATTRRQRTSLDAQRFTFMPKPHIIASPPTTATPITTNAASTTFLLPILLPTSNVKQSNVETKPFTLKELSGLPDARSSTSASPPVPQEIANADLAIAADRSFLETSSATAAMELKKFYERMEREAGLGRGPKLRVLYVITALEFDGKKKYRVSLRQDGDLSSEITPNGTGRPSSIIPSIGGLFSSVITREGARNSHPSGPRQVLRRPRSISEPRESNVYSSGIPTGIVGGFVNPFASTSRHSLDHRRPSIEDSPQGNPNHPYASYGNDNSPFGPGVIYTEPSAPSSPQSTTFTNPALREMQSFESGLTAKADEWTSTRQHPASQFLNKEPTLNHGSMATTPYSTLVFDILQTYKGIPLPDRLSEISNEPTVKLSSTITAVPSDDPRFVIWGEVHSDRLDDFTSSQDSHTDLSTTSHPGVSPRRRSSHARSGESPFTTLPIAQAQEKVIVAATIERWIAQLTSENESFELLYFFLTYRLYISGVDLCHLLICRFHWALEKPTSSHDKTVRALVRARTYKMIRHWLLMWFKVDFATNTTLCQVLANWVNTLRKDPALAKLPDALDLVRRIKKLIRDCKEEAERSKISAPEDSSTSNAKQQPLTSEAERNTSTTRHGNDLSRAGFAATGSIDYPSPPVILAGAQGMPMSQHSTTQSILSQPFHMAMLTQNKSPMLSTHPYPLSTPLPGTLPLQQSTISRVLVNTMGKLGRWKRVLNARSTPMQSQLDCSGVSSFDIEYSSDLQQVNYHLRPPGMLAHHLVTNGPSQASFRDSSSHEPFDGDDEKLPRVSGHLTTLDEGVESDSETKTPQPSLILPKSPLSTTTPETAVADTQNEKPQPSEGSQGFGQVELERLHAPEEQAARAIEDNPLTSPVPDATDAPTAPTQHFSSNNLGLGRPYSDISQSERSVGTTTLAESDVPGTSDQEVAVTTQRRSSVISLGSPSVLTHEGEQHSAASSDYDGRNSFFDSSEEDYGKPISGNAALFSTRPDFVDMDDYQSSDDHSAVEHDQLRRPAKRLPHGRDLKFVSRADTVSSYGDASVSRSSLATEDEATPAPNSVQTPGQNPGRVFAWQLDLIDSEEDEPRDVEAALRRLEGHIDRDRQRRKETKIDGWLRKVEERKARGRIHDDATDDDVTDLQSSKGDPDDEARLETPPDDTPMEETQIEEPLVPLMSNRRTSEQEVDAGVSSMERDTATPIPEHLDQSQRFPPLQRPAMPFPLHEDAVSTGPWAEASVSHRSHKYSMSLSHKQSAFKISEQRPILPLAAPSIRESWILTNRSSRIAQHLTMIESDLWRNIPFEDLVISSPAIDLETKLDVLDWSEFMKQRSRSRGGNNDGGNQARPLNDLLIVRARFQLTAMFTASEILLARPNLRPLIVSKFIRIALKCFALNNFSTLVAIINGLSLSPVQAMLQRMPKSMGSYETRTLESLKSFSSPEGNYRLIREALASLLSAQKSTEAPVLPSAGATTSADTSRACIPFIGIYLSQLYKYDKLPDYVDPTAPTEPVDEEPNGTLTQPRHPEVFASLAPLPPSMTLEPLINVHKQRLISNVVISFMNAQQLTSKYKFVTERKLHQRCMKIRALDMITLHQLSQPEQ